MDKRKEDWKKYLHEQNKKFAVFFISILAIGMIVCVLVFYAINKTEEEEQFYTLNKYLTDKDYLVYGANINAPPLRFLDTDGVYKGVVVDYMSLLALELGVEIRVEPYEWEDALEHLKNGETDLCDMFINEERSKDYVFTDPIYTLRTGLAIQADSKFTFDDISHMCIATEQGDYANYYMQKNFPMAELLYVSDVEDGMKLLAEGDVDAVIGDEPILSYYITEFGQESEFRMINTALYEEPVVLAMPKGHESLVPILNRAIHNVNNQGQLEKIQQKWFGISTPLIQPKTESEYVQFFLFGIIALLAIVSIISWNNKSLKTVVRIRTRELESSRNELQTIFDSIPEYILIMDSQQNIVNANKGLLAFSEMNIEDCIGKPIKVLLEKFPVDDLMDLVEQVLQSDGEKQTFKCSKDIFELQTHCMKKADREILLTIRNITLDEVNKKQLLQSSKMLAIGQLAAGMAHQIRNPLSIIRMHTYILKENMVLDDDEKRSLRFIDESSQKASGIIDNVMNFWHISGNQMENINLYHCLEGMLELHENAMKKKNIQYTIQCEKDLDFISNQESLKHILVNLISNAIDAMHIDGNLLLGGSKTERGIEIICEDNGIGIEDEYLENLFHPFFTTKDPDKGTGLGLFVVYSEVEKLSGEIKVDSRVGEGTCFTIYLPDMEES